MKVLVLAANDAMNLAIENILREMHIRQYEIEIYAPIITEGSIRMFKNMDVPIFPIKELRKEKIAEFDFAFCCEDATPYLRYSDIYVFSYNGIPDVWNGTGSDFMFTMVRERKIRWHEDCIVMPIGDAKNDVPIKYNSSKKQLLYIDAGHNPFGEKAKQQVVNMLLDICREFPNYTILIKPRWLLGEQTTQTHRSGIHIYSVLQELTEENLPDNLVLLNEHRNLQELIDESESVITTSINCWIDVASRGKGCIVVGGFDDEEQFETRVTFRVAYESAKRAGCYVSYDQVIKYLPNGINCCYEYVFNYLPYTSEVSSRIINVMEYVYKNFLKYKTYPAIKEYDYETFKNEVVPSLEITLDELKYKRFKNAICSHFFYNQFEYINPSVDTSAYFQLAQEIYHSYPLNEDGFRRLSQRMIQERRRIIIENTEVCMCDDISQSVLLMALYDEGQYNRILKMSNEGILCAGPYHYYLGMIYNKFNQSSVALSHFCAYLGEANARSFNKYPQECDWGIRNAYNFIFNVYNGDNIDSVVFADLYTDLYTKRQFTIVNYKSRKRAHNFLPKVAEQLVDRDPDRALKCLRLYAKWNYHYNIRERDDAFKAVQNSKYYRLGNKINWLTRKLKGGIRCLQEHGWSYTLHHGLGKIKRKIEKTTIYKTWNIFQTKVIEGYNIYSNIIKEYGDNARLFLSAPAGGDTYIYSSLYKSYLKTNHDNCIPVFCAFEGGAKTIPEMFDIQNVVAFSLQEFHYLYNLLMFDGQRNFHLESLHHHIVYRHTSILGWIEGIHNYDYFSQIKAFLGIENAETEKPSFIYNENIIANFFSKYNLIPQKTILLEPYAKSVKSITSFFWNILAERLLSLGFCVCTNSNGEREPAIEGTTAIFIPYKYSVPFLETMGASIGLRSGFQDVINTAKCLKITLYTDDWKRGLVCKSSEYFSISRMYHQSNQYDLIYTYSAEMQIIEEIVQLVLSHFGRNLELSENNNVERTAK